MSHTVSERIHQYRADEGSLGRLLSAPYSAYRLSRLRRLQSAYLAELEGVSFPALPHDEQIDWLLFRSYLTHETAQIDLEERRIAEMLPLVPFLPRLCELEDARRRREFPDAPAVAQLLHATALEVAALQQNTPSLPRTVANRAVLAVQRLREMLTNWHTYFHGYDPTFTWWVEEPYKALDTALEGYAVHVKEKHVGGETDAILGDPVGREALLADLLHDRIPYTPEELIARAEEERRWCEEHLVVASRQLGFGENWRDALEAVKEQYVRPGDQPRLILELAEEAIRYVEENDLVSVPALAKETWRMEMMSPERQKESPFFLGGEAIIISYPTHTMPHEAKRMSLRGNNPHFARATVHHELIPGHHLQQFMQSRYRPYRRLFFTPFWTEGWTLHWEMLLWERGFGVTPEERIGMLFWRLHRTARVLFSLRFHLGEWSPQECIALLIDGVGHEPANAEAEVRRSCGDAYPPLYQLAYLIGGLQMHTLYHERLQAGQSARAFHDAVMQENCLPIELLRAALSQTPLTPDFPVAWRF